MIEDPRLGLPSGSSALQDSLCYGRFNLQKKWDEETQDPLSDADDNAGDIIETSEIDSDAEAGKRVHLLYAGVECKEASHHERELANLALLTDRSKRQEWLTALVATEAPIEELREHRFWLTNMDGAKVYSGQIDAAWILGAKCGPCDILVADLKGLWGQHDPAKTNAQIRRYIALIAACIQDLGYTIVNSAAAYLNQPAITTDPKMVMYDRDAIDAAVFEMEMEVPLILDPDAPRTPGPVQCHRCKASLICPEFNAEPVALANSIVPINESPAPESKMIGARIALLSDARLESFLPWGKALENAIGMAESEAKRRLKANPDAFGGRYILHPNPPREKITDVKKVYLKLVEEYHIEPNEFTDISTVTKAACEDLVRRKSGLKGQALLEKLKEIYAGACTPSFIAPSLRKVE